jgi:hypothetical protein
MMFSCPKCGSGNVQRTDRLTGGLGMVGLGFLGAFFLGKWGFLIMFVGILFVFWGLLGNRFLLNCNQCHNKWSTS